MKTILLGNAGSGKSILSRRIFESQSAATLSLDELAFSKGAERRPLNDSIEDAKRFDNTNEHWIVEGCYADIVAPLLPFLIR